MAKMSEQKLIEDIYGPNEYKLIIDALCKDNFSVIGYTKQLNKNLVKKGKEPLNPFFHRRMFERHARKIFGDTSIARIKSKYGDDLIEIRNSILNYERARASGFIERKNTSLNQKRLKKRKVENEQNQKMTALSSEVKTLMRNYTLLDAYKKTEVIERITGLALEHNDDKLLKYTDKLLKILEMQLKNLKEQTILNADSKNKYEPYIYPTILKFLAEEIGGDMTVKFHEYLTKVLRKAGVIKDEFFGSDLD